MLVELYIENFALINRLTISFHPQFNVLTGETGAGKSIIVDAMGVLLGGRAYQDFIRSGADRAVVQGLFFTNHPQVETHLAELGITLDREQPLILSREISRAGRSLCRVNGRVVPLLNYQEIGRYLIDIHGQHEHQTLISPVRQRDLLDRFGGLTPLSQQVNDIYTALREVEAQIYSLETQIAQIARDRELKNYQISEIDSARITPGEDAELIDQRNRMLGAERLAASATKAKAILSGSGEQYKTSVLEMLYAVIQELREIQAIDPSSVEYLETLEDMYYQLEEIAHSLRRYAEGLENNQNRLQEIEDRLNTLRQLKRKYGVTLEAVLQYRAEAAASLVEMDNLTIRLSALQEEQNRLMELYQQTAQSLSTRRLEAAERLTGAVTEVLGEMEMPGTSFLVSLQTVDGIRPFGNEDVEFMLAANPGEPCKPLAKVASGGELSRIMLAVKSILAEVDDVPSVIFDEIDSGIGGRTAHAVANRISLLARKRQVICVTHLPQIACFGDYHIVVAKVPEEGRTATKAEVLSGENRVAELVRMLGGSDSSVAYQHARLMLENANQN